MENFLKIVLTAFFSMVWIAVQAFEYRIVSKSENKLPDGVECHLVNVVDCFTVYNDSVKTGQSIFPESAKDRFRLSW